MQTLHRPDTRSRPTCGSFPAVGLAWVGQAFLRRNAGSSHHRLPSLSTGRAREGALFTDYDARQSCTAGRAAFITGRQDPWERYQDESMMYARWWGDKLWTMVPGVNIVGRFLLTFKESPPSQVGGSFSIERALQMVQNGASGGK